MRRVLIALLIVVAVLVAIAAGIFFTGNTLSVLAWIFKPHHGWDPSLKAPAPDYSDARNWAATPDHPGLAALVPKGASAGNLGIAVFFVHPTGEMDAGDWNSPLDPNSRTEENTKWMMANQASVFNGCCAIYAPRYREAAIGTYFSAPPDIFKKTMDLAYGDVDRAFTYFLEHDSKGRPFILASHSQGTFHAFRLIQERIDGTPLANRLVAAYLLGGHITDKAIAGLKTVHACSSSTDLHCIVHWATWGVGGQPFTGGEKLLCVNPLNWQRDGVYAPAQEHHGAVPPSGRFQVLPWFTEARASGIVFAPLGAPVPHWTWAECRKGILTVADQSTGPLAGMDLGHKNYHGLDYPLFAMDLRDNAILRARTYLLASGNR